MPIARIGWFRVGVVGRESIEGIFFAGSESSYSGTAVASAVDGPRRRRRSFGLLVLGHAFGSMVDVVWFDVLLFCFRAFVRPGSQQCCV